MDSKAVMRIREMESILDTATEKIDALEEAIVDFEDYQSEIERLEAYYTGDAWKTDFTLDEEGKLPDDLKRGVLSEDGIYDLLERNKELRERLDSRL